MTWPRIPLSKKNQRRKKRWRWVRKKTPQEHIPYTTFKPATSVEFRNGTDTEYPWISLKHPDGGPPPERGTCSGWNDHGFILGWDVGPHWGVSTGLRDRTMGWLALRGYTPSQPTSCRTLGLERALGLGRIGARSFVHPLWAWGQVLSLVRTHWAAPVFHHVLAWNTRPPQAAVEHDAVDPPHSSVGPAVPNRPASRRSRSFVHHGAQLDVCDPGRLEDGTVHDPGNP